MTRISMVQQVYTTMMLSLYFKLCISLSSPPVFTLNISEEPANRWLGALELVAATSSFEQSWLPSFAYHNASLFNGLDNSQWELLGDSLASNFPQQSEELKGLSSNFMSVYGQYVSYEYLAGWVYFHELAHSDLVIGETIPRPECTAFLSQNHGGNIIHGANMDQSPETVRLLTLKIRFVDANGTLLFQGVDWYWFTTGVTRAVKANVISIQENWRSSPQPRTLSEVLDDISVGTIPQVFVFRKFLESYPDDGMSFDDAIAEFSSIPLAAPFYIVVAGVNAGEGAIITRNETGVEGPSDKTNSNSIPRLDISGRSTLVQTNYDWWLDDPAYDPRKTSAVDIISQISASGDVYYDVGMNQGLFVLGVVSSYPVHNPHTVYTAMMSACETESEGMLTAFVRVAMCPQHRVGNAYLDDMYCPVVV